MSKHWQCIKSIVIQPQGDRLECIYICKYKEGSLYFTKYHPTLFTQSISTQ